MKIKEEEKRLAKEKKDLSIWQRMGKHLGENAAARDKLFTTIGAMGREMVKPDSAWASGGGSFASNIVKRF